MRRALLCLGLCVAWSWTGCGSGPPTGTTPLRSGATRATPNPILFVTQLPLAANFNTVTNTFGNHVPTMDRAPRGGDLYIRYPDGTLRNLTREAGFGTSGAQGDGAIAVREPCVHWDGQKAVFSMVVGAPTKPSGEASYVWQLYEVTGLGLGEKAVITKVDKQPDGVNNVAPFYGTDDRILFASDRSRTGEAHLYPLFDEYDEAPSVTGIWSLDPKSGDLFLVDHSPSGSFSGGIDSYGRVIFTRWDHLQRDQQAEADASGGTHGTFDYADESATAARGPRAPEAFPEAHADPEAKDDGVNAHVFNQFFPWQIDEDGQEEETVNHVGRHELFAYFKASFLGDPSLVDFQASGGNPNRVRNVLETREDPTRPGHYLAVSAPEFDTHSAGQLFAFDAPPDLPADSIRVTWITDPSTFDAPDPGAAVSPNSTGKYRDPIVLSDGTLLAAYSAESHADRAADGKSTYHFRIAFLAPRGDLYAADATLTAGVDADVSYYDPDHLVHYAGEMWELEPVEVRARPRPARRHARLEAPEQSIFDALKIDPAALQADLRAKGLALVVSRNVTVRDGADRQQPFNLRVHGTATQTTGDAGKIYDVSQLDFLQADQLRGLGGVDHPTPGRRVLARPMHDPAAIAANGGAVARIAGDGSVAAFVPARRALTWQLTDPSATPVVRERYWVTFAPGEIRVCPACHGVNTKDQSGGATPQTSPEALRALLAGWKPPTP